MSKKQEQEVVSELQENQQPEKVGGIWQVIKFALFSASAGIIQIVSFTLMNEVLIKLPFIQNNDSLVKLLENDQYGPTYLIALLLSVLWNFTFNRKFTFKSAMNVKKAMALVLLFYVFFTPISTLLGIYFSKNFTTDANAAYISYIILGCTMACNLVTEFLWDKFVVYKGQEGTATKKEKK